LVEATGGNVEKYIVIAEIIKQILQQGRGWWIPATAVCWKLPDILAAVLK
jgi:hypothetical protein